MKVSSMLLLVLLGASPVAQADDQVANVWSTGDPAIDVPKLGQSLQQLAAAPSDHSICDHVRVVADYAILADRLRTDTGRPIEMMGPLTADTHWILQQVILRKVEPACSFVTQANNSRHAFAHELVRVYLIAAHRDASQTDAMIRDLLTSWKLPAKDVELILGAN